MNRKGRLESVEAVVTADLLDEIDFPEQIDAVGRGDGALAIGSGRYRQPEAAQDPLDVGVSDSCTEQRREPRAAQMQR